MNSQESIPVRVSVRCRPLNKKESSKVFESECVKVQDNQVSVGSSSSFTFDFAHGKEATQEEVYEPVKPLVEGFIGGMNGTVLAYGQTGTGKTHTMSGSEDMPGVMPRVIKDIFAQCEAVTDYDITLKVSYVEVNRFFLSLPRVILDQYIIYIYLLQVNKQKNYEEIHLCRSKVP